MRHLFPSRNANLVLALKARSFALTAITLASDGLHYIAKNNWAAQALLKQIPSAQAPPPSSLPLTIRTLAG
jgi:hypothetical protein